MFNLVRVANGPTLCVHVRVRTETQCFVSDTPVTNIYELRSVRRYCLSMVGTVLTDTCCQGLSLAFQDGRNSFCLMMKALEYKVLHVSHPSNDDVHALLRDS